jgi:hypothetical protein
MSTAKAEANRFRPQDVYLGASAIDLDGAEKMTNIGSMVR